VDQTIPSAGLGTELEGQLQAVVDSLSRVYHRQLVSVLLYGSAARGDFIAGRSDVNLLVILQSVKLEDLAEAVAPAEVGNCEPIREERYLLRLLPEGP
jgi:predicted nucleotidyltransferase